MDSASSNTITVSVTVICQLINDSSNTELTTAAMGGIVVQVVEVSMVQVAIAAVVIRPASAPGKRSAKYRVPWLDRCSNKSSFTSPLTATKALVEIQPARRQSRLSPATKPNRIPTAPHRTLSLTQRCPRTSTRFLTAYCEPIEQPDGRQDGGQHDQMADPAASDVMQEKRDGSPRCITWNRHEAPDAVIVGGVAVRS